MSVLDPLNLLLKASSKSIVEKCLMLVFTSRYEPKANCVEIIQGLLELEHEEASQLHGALWKCIEVTITSGVIEDLAEFLNEKGKTVNSKLKQLVGQCIAAKLESWKESIGSNRISFPKLVDVDWEMHIKRSSSQVRNMMVPSVVISLHIEDQPLFTDDLPNTSIVPVECNYNSLETMLEGLNKIKEQLNTMGK